jgi:hypothetical protein
VVSFPAGTGTTAFCEAAFISHRAGSDL